MRGVKRLDQTQSFDGDGGEAAPYRKAKSGARVQAQDTGRARWPGVEAERWNDAECGACGALRGSPLSRACGALIDAVSVRPGPPS